MKKHSLLDNLLLLLIAIGIFITVIISLVALAKNTSIIKDISVLLASIIALTGVLLSQYMQYKNTYKTINANYNNLKEQLQTQINISQEQFSHSFAIEQDKEMRDSKKESLFGLNIINQCLRDLIDTEISLINSGIGRYYYQKVKDPAYVHYLEGIIKKEEELSLTLKENLEKHLNILSTHRVIYNFCTQEALNKLISLTDTFQKESNKLQNICLPEDISRLNQNQTEENLHSIMKKYELIRDDLRKELIIDNASIFTGLEDNIKNSSFTRSSSPPSAP